MSSINRSKSGVLECSVGEFRNFWNSKDVWGNGKPGDVYMDDELFHVKKSDGIMISYTSEYGSEKLNSESKVLVLTDDFLDCHDDEDMLYIECGYILASKESKTTKFVRNTSFSKRSEWSSEVADIFEAWLHDSPEMLSFHDLEDK